MEVQILADEYGNVIHLGERDCSIQRNHQKIIEETPSTILDEKLRNKMGEMAIKVAKIAKYIYSQQIEELTKERIDFIINAKQICFDKNILNSIRESIPKNIYSNNVKIIKR